MLSTMARLALHRYHLLFYLIGFGFVACIDINGEFLCDFESDCGFTQRTDDIFDWTRKSGSTDTPATGPSGDHTTGRGFYMYTESSTPRKKDDNAIIERTVPICKNQILIFWYHMYGFRMGTLNVYVGGSKVFNQSGNQGNDWIKAIVPLSQTGHQMLSFEGIQQFDTGDQAGHLSDMAIDDITIASPISIGFLNTSLTVSENDDYASVCVVRQDQAASNLAEVLSVRLSTVQGTAVKDEDFTSLDSILVTFGVDEMLKCVNVTIKDDDITENMETFFVTMTSNSTVVNVNETRNNLTINIKNDDKVVIGFSKTSLTVSESDGYASVCMVRQGQAASNLRAGALNVRLSTVQGTAVKDEDFTSLDSILVIFGVDEMLKCVNVMIKNDDITENMELFFVSMTSSSAVVTVNETRNNLTINIKNDDKVSIGFSKTFLTVSENDGYATVCMVRQGQAASNLRPGALNVRISTLQDNAEKDNDFTFNSSLVIFGLNETLKCVTIKDDDITENTERFFVTMMSSSIDVTVDESRNKLTINIGNDDQVTAQFEQQYNKSIEEDVGKIELACVIDGKFSVPVQIGFVVDNITSTAIMGSDFTMDKNLTFLPGKRMVNLKIKINLDSVVETTEVLVLRMVTLDDNLVVIGTNDTATVRINDKSTRNDIRELLTILLFVAGVSAMILLLILIAIIIFAFCKITHDRKG